MHGTCANAGARLPSATATHRVSLASPARPTVAYLIQELHHSFCLAFPVLRGVHASLLLLRTSQAIIVCVEGRWASTTLTVSFRNVTTQPGAACTRAPGGSWPLCRRGVRRNIQHQRPTHQPGLELPFCCALEARRHRRALLLLLAGARGRPTPAKCQPPCRAEEVHSPA